LVGWYVIPDPVIKMRAQRNFAKTNF